MKARMLLSNGMIFEGESVGAEGTNFGELVFNTSMAGYQEILTDPSYASQIVVMTYPEIGNYGINNDDFESDKVHPVGFIMKNYSKEYSHYKAVKTLSEYLKENNVVGINGLDTRTLTKIIREVGAMYCVVTTEKITDKIREELRKYEMDKNLVLSVSRKTPKKINGSGIKLAVIDLGIKNSILREFSKVNCNMTVFQADVDAKTILDGGFDAVFLSNGPGDPQDAKAAIETTKQLVGKLPLFGICLGFQILSIVTGANTYKLKYGHRGGNHPVINLETNKVLVTSQNHGYAVDEETLSPESIATYRNLNDGTLEGFRVPCLDIEGVQFHPESAPGPTDANDIIKDWDNKIKKEEESCQKIYQ